jgi:hypothetical protein
MHILGQPNTFLGYQRRSQEDRPASAAPGGRYGRRCLVVNVKVILMSPCIFYIENH